MEDAAAFEDLMARERIRIRDAATALLVASGADQLAVNRCVEARALARRALALDPFSEPAVSRAMRSAEIGVAVAPLRIPLFCELRYGIQRFAFPPAAGRAEQFEALAFSVGLSARRLGGRWTFRDVAE